MKNFSLMKHEHIRKRNEIKNIFNSGSVQSDRYLKMYFKKNDLNYTRFAIIINKKYGNAVKRNQAKRYLREIFRLNKNKIKPGFDLIFFIKNEFYNLTFIQKTDCFLTLAGKLD